MRELLMIDFLKSRGVLRGKYAYATLDADQNQYGWTPPDSDKYFCSQGCKHEWLNHNIGLILNMVDQ